MKQRDAEVIILGAGPVGLTIANYLGQAGIDVLVLEKLEHIIDYPRAIGIDDEALRTIQSIGLIDKVLPHTTPWHWMRFLTPKGRCFASIEPKTDEFGWSRRNAFIQPQVDKVLYEGLERFPNVRFLFSREMQQFSQDDESVAITVKAPGDTTETYQAQYLIACDGGNSQVRRDLNIPFDGKTAPNKWIVVDIRNDPLGTPNIYLCADPVRPYVSAALPHGVRRFEFMVMKNETEEALSQPESMRQLLSKVLPDPDKVDLIRQRVYAHNARVAGRFRDKRVLLAGDAAHIMPVWQGQGYNSGMRDASNLAWKMGLVIKGLVKPELLDSYEDERQDHARAMVDLSVTAGNVLNPPRKWMATARDILSWWLNYIPAAKRYFLEMRFKPMPKYTKGAQVAASLPNKTTPVGTLFIQPKVRTDAGEIKLLDDVIGARFAIIAWGTNPQWGLDAQEIAQWQRLGAAFIQILPDVQMQTPNTLPEGVIRLGDVQGRLKEWFSRYPYSVTILRPDRFVAGLATPQTLSATSMALHKALHTAEATQ
jgi:3-(3-hydroxy-phenyl)propionate hydroxylase